VSLDPSFSPDGRLLAFVKAPDAGTDGWPPLSWYRAHALEIWNTRTGVTRQIGPVDGAQLPVWSRDGRRLLFVANDGLWLTSLTGGRPTEIERPLYPQRAWNSLFRGAFSDDFYGQMPWSAQFSWSGP
jgi:TolB protein